MAWFSHTYIPKREFATNPIASPLFAESHADLPPALVIVAQHDVLKDEGLQYAAALARSGCSVTVRGASRVPHGFMSMRALFPKAHAAAMRDVVQFLRFWCQVHKTPPPTAAGGGGDAAAEVSPK